MSGDKTNTGPMSRCGRARLAGDLLTECVWVRGRNMRQQDQGFDYERYHRLLAEAVDEQKRLALIQLLIEEKAMDRLAAQRASDRAAMTAETVAKVLRAARR